MGRRKLDFADTIRAALEKGKPGPDLAKALQKWDQKELTQADANGLVAVLAEQTDVEPLLAGADEGALRHLADLFQHDSTDDATRVLRDRGMKELARLFDAAAALPDCPPAPLAVMCQIFALYAYAPGVSRVAETVRRYPFELMWDTIFGLYGEENHPHGPELAEQLRDPLPEGFAAVVLLDLANALARQKRLKKHPFDTRDGRARIEAWLTDSDEAHFSYAHSAASALPFLDAKNRAALAALAMDHPSVRVQMEAAWASAFRGGTAGLKFLTRLCADPRHSLSAQRYLDDLGKSDLVPSAAREPDFEATAQMCEWLAHPSEYGAPPDEIELYDTRELDWPPTNDRRRVWLFKFAYPDRAVTALGMAGSITFSLCGETSIDMSAEDAYGLHCCWELEVNGDPRAPKRRSAKAGRKLLKI